MTNIKKCIDCYGEELKVGDEVIPVLEEALIFNIGGIISNIEFSEKYNCHYIYITDSYGNSLLNGVDSREYTTKERYEERENQEYVYSLTFYNKMLWPITTIPLTNKTNTNYLIPDETCFAALTALHKQKKLNDTNCSSYFCENIFYFVVEDKIEMYKNNDESEYYLQNLETYDCIQISSKNRLFETRDDLKKYIKKIIKYFNMANLIHINNDIEYDMNTEAQDFEKELVKFIKH